MRRIQYNCLLTTSRMTLMGVALASCAVLPVSAQETGADEPAIERALESEYLLRQLRSGSAREQFIASTVSPLRNADRDGDGLDQGDVERRTLSDLTNRRGSIASSFIKVDYDGDLRLTLDELIENSVVADADRRQRRAESIMEEFDTDENGVATLDEALATAAEPRFRRDDRLSSLLELDPNRNGVLTADELGMIAEKMFARFDLDRDNLIGAEEFEIVSEARRAARERLELIQSGCKLTPASPNAEIVLFGAFNGKRRASAYVGNPDSETAVIDVEIEPGTAPLYLILASGRANIWRLSGATERVEQVVAASSMSAQLQTRRATGGPITTSSAGVIGLPESKVLVGGPRCVGTAYQITDNNRKKVDAVAKIIAGRSPDVMASEGAPHSIALPSATVTQPDDFPPARAVGWKRYESTLWRVVEQEGSAWLVRIDPETIVSSEPTGSYEPLPGHYGIAQMVERGVLEPDNKNRLRVMRDIERWPAGLVGNSSVAFVVPEGIKVPEGSPGNSCVISEQVAKSELWKNACRIPPPAPPPIRVAPTRQ